MKKLAIIPARGGSKRIPKKNIKDFFGKPVIQYSIETALNSELFDEVMVSTDDPEIAKISENCGASVPFFRPAEFATDVTPLAAVMINVIDAYEENNLIFDQCCCILPCAPLITSQLLREALYIMQSGAFDSVVPFVKYPVPIEQAFIINDTGKIRMFFEDKYGINTQNLRQTYYDAGMFYWFMSASVRKHKRISTNNTAPLILSELQTHDIDYPEDWEIAKFKYLMLHNKFKMK